MKWGQSVVSFVKPNRLMPSVGVCQWNLDCWNATCAPSRPVPTLSDMTEDGEDMKLSFNKIVRIVTRDFHYESK